MTKFTNRPTARPTGPVRSTGITRTHEGAVGYSRDAESELFLLAATNMVSEGTFYESATARDERFQRLVHQVAKTNPEWLLGAEDLEQRTAGKVGFIEYLRNTLQMRSASLVMAAEFVRSGAPGGRRAVRQAISRADEPAEILGYWMSQYGRKLPAALKRGVADAVVRLYTERNALKWDGQSKDIRFADVIELVHPRPRMVWGGKGAPPAGRQSDLFKYLLDRRHHPDNAEIPDSLELIHLDRRLLAMPTEGRRVALKEGLVAEAGWSWERLAGWLPGGMDSEAWMSVIPQMGYMALIRNLRNFDDAGIYAKVKSEVCRRIEDPEEVAKSRQFPYRFWSAYKNAPSLEWGASLERALDYSCRNIPELSGRSLILIDTSASMNDTVSDRSKARRFEVGALFAGALAKRAANPTVVIFGDQSKEFPIGKSESVLRYVDRVGASIGSVGHGTMIWRSVQEHFANHDRVVIFTDEQSMDDAGQPMRTYYGRSDGIDSSTYKAIPAVHAFNLAGYRAGTVPPGSGRYTYGGFTDATFVLMAALEAGSEAGWPF
ncbi:MAG TPA: TROVE domain-containing protein [Gemmatimonadales bacterium]|nr:TROVE domain-containing protein [Gemmatimonadales bacterium]